MINRSLKNRFVIALNRKEIVDDLSDIKKGEKKITIDEVAEIMDVVRKYPKYKINQERLHSCGFIMN
ncbi:MAG: hypothetical protein H3C31_04210 [Brumimicrobium sp.]|nr:hypothetical protein [Brumimicrobium sp.]MCO5268882.1 hypothetical protein [Brumimicrobium sp.]